MSRKYPKYSWLVLSFIGLCVGITIISVAGAKVNIDHSIPPGLYWKVNRPFQKGAYVLTDIREVSALGTRRGYANGFYTIGKKIVAVSGDTVSVSSKGVFVNGQKLINSKPLSEDSEGRPLPLIDSTFVLKDGQYFLMGITKESFDSRYFGPVNKEDIISTIIPIITF